MSSTSCTAILLSKKVSYISYSGRRSMAVCIFSALRLLCQIASPDAELSLEAFIATHVGIEGQAIPIDTVR